MRLTSSKSCGNKNHKVSVIVYDFETIEHLVGTATFQFEGSTKDIARQVDSLGVDPSSTRICRQACCQMAAAATGIQDVEEILNG